MQQLYACVADESTQVSFRVIFTFEKIARW